MTFRQRMQDLAHFSENMIFREARERQLLMIDEGHLKWPILGRISARQQAIGANSRRQ
jgi:hypothetical protein